MFITLSLCCEAAVSFCRCLQSPISISRNAQKPRVLSTHYWFWAAFSPAAICTYFFFYSYFHQYMHSFCHFLGIHWVCDSCTIPFSPSTAPTIQTQYCTVHSDVPTTHKVFNSFFSPVRLSTYCSRSFTLSQCTEQPINPKIYCNGTISFPDFTTWCTHFPECRSAFFSMQRRSCFT